MDQFISLVEQKPARFTTKGRYNKQLLYLHIIPHKRMNKGTPLKIYVSLHYFKV